MSAEQRRVWASPADVALWLQLGDQGERKLRNMRRQGTGPKYITLGREVRYAWADVHAWCAAQREAGR